MEVINNGYVSKKRKMRQEKKNNDSQESFSKVSISCEEWANAKPSRKVDLPTFFA